MSVENTAKYTVTIISKEKIVSNNLKITASFIPVKTQQKLK